MLGKIDPAKTTLDVKLNKIDADVPDDQKMTGRIVDEKGQPVVGAQVWITGAKQGGRKWWGRVRNTDKVAFSDENGQFLLTSSVPYEQWQLTVNARRFAKLEAEQEAPTPDDSRLHDRAQPHQDGRGRYL